MSRTCIIFVLSCAISFIIANQRFHRNACKPVVDLKCHHEGNRRYTYYIYHELAFIKPGCAGNKITKTEWSLVSMQTKRTILSRRKTPNSYHVEDSLTIRTRVGPPGNYSLQLIAEESKGGRTTTKCLFRYVSEPPSIVFTHGQMQYALTGMPYTVDITQSDFQGNAYPAVTWTVRCLYIEETKTACKKTHPCDKAAPMKGVKFIGIMNACFNDLTFTATIDHDVGKVSAKHIVSPRKMFNCKVDMICEKNCDKGGSQLSNPLIQIVLKIKPANLNCLGFDGWRPKWIVKGSGPSKKDQLEVLDDHKRLIIKANSLTFGDSAAVLATEVDHFEAWYRIKTVPKIDKADCTITPKSGRSLVTKFTVNCKPKSKHLELYGPYYMIYQMVNGKKNLLVSSADENFQIILSSIKGQPSQTLIIEGHDIFENPFECNVNPVTVKDVDVSRKSAKQHLENIKRFLHDDNPLGPQYAMALLHEVNQDVVDKEFQKEVKTSIMGAVHEMDIKTLPTYEQIASVTSMFVDVEDMSTRYKRNLAKLCLKMSRTHVHELERSAHVKYQETTVKQQTQLNADCATKLLEPTKEEEAKFETTTMPDVEPVIKEDYPDYQMAFDDPMTEEIKTAGMDIITESAKAIAMTLTAGEHHQQITDVSNSIISVEEGNYMAEKRLEIGTIGVIAAKQFKDEGENPITAIISNYDRNVLMPRSDLSSDIVDIDFFKNSEKMNVTSYTIEFPVNESVPFEWYEVEPAAADDQFSDIDKKMNVHRLDLFALETCLIRFQLGENVKLRVALSVNQRPRKRHFTDGKSGFEVNGNDSNSWVIQNPFSRSDADSLFYVAVIPHPEMLESNGHAMVPYEVQFTQVACVTYDLEKHQWIPTEFCDVNVTGSDDDTVVNCLCTKQSLHSVFFKPIPHRLDEQIDVEFTVVDIVNYIIFGHVLVVFVAFVIALALSLKRQPKVFGRDKIFFLSDNLKNDKFCYMLVIRTGSFSSSGTTSNIMIQVFGAKGKSKPHVLNYPDPSCSLLQRDNVDWMIMAHSVHLGDLESILLWTDAIGLYPAWYCQDITIWDLQKNASFVFKVEAWLSPLEKHHHYLRVQIFQADDSEKKDKLNLVKHIRFHYLGRHTWNIFVKDDEDLTYPERLTVILSMIYTTYVMAILLLGAPGFTRADAFGYGAFQFYSEIFTFALAASVICSAIHLPIIYFLRNSKMGELSSALVVTVKPYPFKVRIILWYFLIIWIVLCLMYLLTFGFWETEETLFLWIIIHFLSLVTSIVVWENVAIILVDVIWARVGYVEKQVYRFDAIVVEIERQRKILFKKFGEVLLRPYFRRHYRLLTPNELFLLRQSATERLKVARLFEDMCLFLVYIGILYLICIVQYDDLINKSNKMMHRMVVESIYGNKSHLLDNIGQVEDVYDYLEQVIIPTIHPTKWYGEWYASDAGLLADYATRILGVVQLRQQRRSQKCNLPHQLRALQIPCTNDAPIFENWEFNDGSDITATTGHYRMYDGSGYIANLGRTLKNSQFILKLLRENKWIDINTAVFFIDFLTYNANNNMFNAVSIIIERSPSGRFRNSCQIFTAALVYTNFYIEIFVAFLLILLTIVIVVMLLKRLVEILILKGSYFADFWNFLDCTLSVLSIALIVLFFLRKQYTMDVLKAVVETDHNVFVNYYHLITLSRTATITYGITLSLATLRLWKFLHFGVLFRIMERTILKAGPALLGIFLYQVIVYLMMVSFIYPMYGEMMHAFRDYYTSLVTLYLASINFTEHLPNLDTTIHNSFLYLVYSIYLIISLCFLNAYATALIINLEESRIRYSNATHLYSINTYVVDVFRFYKEKLRRHLEGTRLKGGANEANFNMDVDKLVSPKADEHRYADMVSMNRRKMKLMKNIALVAIKNMKKFERKHNPTEKDFDFMAEIVVNWIKNRNEEKDRFAHIFFKGWDPLTGKCIFVPDTKILQMEMIVRKLLEGKASEIKIDQDVKNIVLHQSGDHRRLRNMRKCLNLIKSTIEHIRVMEDTMKLQVARRPSLDAENARKNDKEIQVEADVEPVVADDGTQTP